VKPGLDIFRDHGYDWIRLRIFHTPTELPNDLEYTIALAQAAQERGFRFLLDYHYADGWADPQKQPIPAAWDTTNVEMLADSVREWTSYTIRAFREAGVMPDMVQIGNEVRNGMMWPLGRLPDNWDNFARLFQAGLEGIGCSLAKPSDRDRLDCLQVFCLRTAQRVPQVPVQLPVEPKLRGRPEQARQAQCRIRRYSAPSIHDLVYARVGNADTPREFGLRHPERDEKLLPKHLPWMSRRTVSRQTCHGLGLLCLSDNRRSRRPPALAKSSGNRAGTEH